MANNSIFVDTKQIDRLALELSGFEKEVAEATYHALNRTFDHVITKTGQLVSKQYSIKSGDVKDVFKGGIKKPTKTNLTASLVAKGHTLSLARFPHSPGKPGAKVKKVTVAIKKGAGKKQVNSAPKPFLAPTGAKSEDKIQFNIFHRTGKERLPITVIRTLSIPQMITNENISKQIQEAAAEKLAERLEHEITRQMTSSTRRIKG